MNTSECLPLWTRILDCMARLLPTDADQQLDIALLRERVADALAGDSGPIEDLESRLREFASRHSHLLAAATDETVGEMFSLVDPIIRDLRRAKLAGTINDNNHAAAKGFIAMLEACGAGPCT
jgi:hypothetical protein